MSIGKTCFSLLCLSPFIIFVGVKWHVFNPENDLALACFSPHFIPPRSARQMAADLAVLPAWWARPGDAVCVPRPDEARLWAGSLGGLLPPLLWTDGMAGPGVTEVVSWGWSPLLAGRLREMGVRPELLPGDETLCRYRDWSHRRHAVDLLAWLRGGGSRSGRGWGGRLCGVSCYCTDEAGIARRLAEWPDALLKAPWSGSGKGLRRGCGGYAPPLAGWCRRVLRGQGGVVVEPIYNKVYDFAMEFEADGCGTVVYKGLSRFSTTPRGTYGGNRVASEDAHLCWLSSFVPRALWQALRDDLAEYLSRWLGSGYRGPLGVDMMLCRMEGCGDLCVHPCVEINLRRTMGCVAADLARLLAPGVEARFRIDYCASEGGLRAAHCRGMQEAPPQVSGGKLSAGCLPLTPVGPDTHYRAVLESVE